MDSSNFQGLDCACHDTDLLALLLAEAQPSDVDGYSRTRLVVRSTVGINVVDTVIKWAHMHA